MLYRKLDAADPVDALWRESEPDRWGMRFVEPLPEEPEEEGDKPHTSIWAEYVPLALLIIGYLVGLVAFIIMERVLLG